MNRAPNGYIMPDGTYVQLDDLAGMERSLKLLHDGDMFKVLDGLREVVLELGKEFNDEACRRFLARAQEIAAGDVDEGQRLMKLGIHFELIERFDLAGECYEYGRSLGCLDEESWYFLHNNHAYCLDMLERFTEAAPLARKAIKIDPSRHNAHKNLGLALMGQGRLREAAKCFRKTTALRPTDGRSAQYLAIVEERLMKEPVRQIN